MSGQWGRDGGNFIRHQGCYRYMIVYILCCPQIMWRATTVFIRQTELSKQGRRLLDLLTVGQMVVIPFIFLYQYLLTCSLQTAKGSYRLCYLMKEWSVPNSASNYTWLGTTILHVHDENDMVAVKQILSRPIRAIVILCLPSKMRFVLQAPSFPGRDRAHKTPRSSLPWGNWRLRGGV